MSSTLVSHRPTTLLVTGGAGFIGSNFIKYWLDRYPNDTILNLDALTYAGTLTNLAAVSNHPNYTFVKGSINDVELVDSLMSEVDIVVHFAAESHVDRSIKNPGLFVETNVLGTQVLLDAATKHKIQRFHHISTDEVFGTLALDMAGKFTEASPYDPRSPYSASKAGSDHLVRAYGETYEQPYSITNCSNNYGPQQFPEKLIPLAITNLLDGLTVPVYGDGRQVRDWLHVLDHCHAIELVLLQGKPNHTYLVGGLTEDISNLELVSMLVSIMKEDDSKISMVSDRPGHDRRYSVDWSTIKAELGWEPHHDLETGLRNTVAWYREHESWWRPLKAANSAYFTSQYDHSTKK
jgi:dTDP-glucose 4,6-dehydratase